MNEADILHASCASTEQENRREDKRSHGEVDADPDIGANTEELTMNEDEFFGCGTVGIEVRRLCPSSKHLGESSE